MPYSLLHGMISLLASTSSGPIGYGQRRRITCPSRPRAKSAKLTANVRRCSRESVPVPTLRRRTTCSLQAKTRLPTTSTTTSNTRRPTFGPVDCLSPTCRGLLKHQHYAGTRARVLAVAASIGTEHSELNLCVPSRRPRAGESPIGHGAVSVFSRGITLCLPSIPSPVSVGRVLDC